MSLHISDSRTVDEKTAHLVEDAWNKMTLHWQALLPALDVVIVSGCLDKVPALKEFVADIALQAETEEKAKEFWQFRQVVCWTPSSESSTLYVRMKGDHPYNFQKELYGVFAKILWGTSSALRKKGIDWSTGMCATDPDLAYIGFRDSFSRYFLNPSWLQESREDAWVFMQRLDQFVADGCK